MGLQTPSTPLVPFLTPLLVIPGPVQWLAVNMSPPHFFLSSGRASQETTISGFFQHALLGIYNSVLVGNCIWDEFPGGTLLKVFVVFLLICLFIYYRSKHHTLLKIHQYLGELCSHLLSRKDIMEFLKNENFDLVLLDSIDICALLTVEKLGKQFVSFLPFQFSYIDFGLPSAPLSYAPVYGSGLTDQMDFWGRHFVEGSQPVLSELLLKAELWFVNSDFALDFARPLFPNKVYVGGLLDKPVQPIPQDLENFISQFGDSGFVLVALGSVVSMIQSKEIIKEMNSAFAHLPQGVLWTCKSSHWPKDVSLAPNVKIMDWLPQIDLLAHPSIRLFVTHGGMSSVMEAVQHGVPMVGIPFFSDQPENMVRVEAKNLGVSIQLQKLKAESFALTMKEVIEDQRYKTAAMASKIIRNSHPLTPVQRLVGWIDHILQTGGAAHLKPYAFQQPWHEQYMLDVFFFLLGLMMCTLWLCVKVFGVVTRYLSGARKVKQS
uniref:UDP-glucuronosyltransferase n=1 Tax=Mus spicilegus TaxID=10103 RepID=A0A8C6IHW6_MUSSI